MAINSIGSGYSPDYSNIYSHDSQTPTGNLSEAAQDLMSALQSANLENVPEQNFHFLNPEALHRFNVSNQYDSYSRDSVQLESISIGDGDSKDRGFMEYPDGNAHEQWEEPRPLWLSLYKLAQSLFDQTDQPISTTQGFQARFLSSMGTRLAFNPFI